MSGSVYDKYEAVIGLEVHAQLLTKSKAFSPDPNEYGAHPNTNISVISLGHPGTLPVHNKEAVKFAVRLGLACSSKIREINEYARKNYFYADLPKGYQITQDKTPICTGGHINIKLAGGERKKVGLTRIHMEEDAGKSMHDQDVYNTLIDLNRAGVPLLEIVSEPDMRSGEEAYQYVTEVRKLVRYLDICDGNMEEGSLRCDANISVRLKGAPAYGTKVEVKNMNSMRNVQRAIEHEITRQIDELEAGRTFDSETRSFDALKGTTFSMRSKEGANDYRYFPEPDLPPVQIAASFIESVKASMPALPEQLVEKYTSILGLSTYDAHVLTENKETAAYFEEVTAHTKNVKSAANWVMGPVRSQLNEQAMELKDFKLPPHSIAQLIQLIDDGKISNSAASQKIFPELVKNPGLHPLSVAESLNLLQESNADTLKTLIDEVISRYPEKVTEYKSGKTSLVGMFMGEVMKLSKGKADPKVASQLVKETLDNL